MFRSTLPSFAFPLAAAAAVLAFACGGAPPPAPAAPTGPAVTSQGADAKKGGAEDSAASKSAAIDALTVDESKKGACDDGHKAALEKLLADVEAGMKTKVGDDGKPLGFQLVGSRVIPLGSASKSIEMAVSGRGTEVHVLAFGVRDVSLDVLVGKEAATTLRSPFQRSATATPPTLDLAKIGKVTDVQSDSRQVTIKPGQPIVVRLSGQGCAGLVSFLKP